MKRVRLRSKQRSFDSQHGFTLAETLVALFIISLAATLLGQFVRLSVASETRTSDAIEKARDMGIALRESTQVELETGDTLEFEPIQPTLNAECLYDVVGRRCR